MARGKKKEENLTLEEKLEQALVPEEEWPYEVPGNWCWVRLKDIALVITGGTPSKNKTEYYGGTFPFFKPADLDYGRNMVAASEFLSEEGKAVSRLIPAKSTAVCCIGSIGKCGYLCVDGTTNQQINSVVPKVNSLFLYYYCNTILFTKQLRLKASATTISIVNKSKMEECLFPLPPLREQQRIATHIEEMFYKLDEMKEKVQYVLESSENRKAAILHKAFSGELTEHWRRDLGIGSDSWKKLKFYEVAQIKSNLVEPKEYMEYPHIAPDNIEKRSGKLLQYNTIAEDKVFSSKHRFFSGQILYSKIRPYLSKVVLVDFEGLCSADMYPIEAKENAKYLWYYMLSDDFLEQASSAGSRSVLPKINQKELSNLDVCIPSEIEQNEIVKILDKLFPLQESIKRKCERVITQVDVLKKSILSRAFRGELGTNNPDEENAIELLKTIL